MGAAWETSLAAPYQINVQKVFLLLLEDEEGEKEAKEARLGPF